MQVRFCNVQTLPNVSCFVILVQRFIGKRTRGMAISFSNPFLDWERQLQEQKYRQNDIVR